ncbi:protein turtle homolog B [Procambarus clarkii]|uniref:protein turtle homolog B n=1 Tax=Procambarus clarkii TaxID=6728 RepID=UPI001E670E4E|nr:protein turtle homolog B-like [Procambarus clarkii]
MIHQNLPKVASLALVWTTLLCLPGCVWAWPRVPRHVVPPPTVPGPTLPPVFDPQVPTNVTVTASKTALLSCVVHNLGNNSVSWIRHRDLHILSVGSVTYTSDSRFEAVPQTGKGDWMLRLQYANTRDSGQYDCQVSSTPPTARTVHLTVVEPQAKILRAPDIHVGIGSPINLTCVVPYSPEPPDYLHWYHKERMVREDGLRVWVRTQLGGRSLSQLVVKDAQPQDSGVYTCSPAHSLEHSITVHVLTGEYPAAMQGGSSVTCAGRRLWALLLTAVVTATVSTPLLLTYFYM